MTLRDLLPLVSTIGQFKLLNEAKTRWGHFCHSGRPLTAEEAAELLAATKETR